VVWDWYGLYPQLGRLTREVRIGLPTGGSRRFLVVLPRYARVANRTRRGRETGTTALAFA